MLVKLIQATRAGDERTVDIAGSIDKLNFSGLCGYSNWRIDVIWGNRVECIARVAWSSATGYRIYESCAGLISRSDFIYHGAIVPAVKRRLQQLFQKGKIGHEVADQTIVRVQTIV